MRGAFVVCGAPRGQIDALVRAARGAQPLTQRIERGGIVGAVIGEHIVIVVGHARLSLFESASLVRFARLAIGRRKRAAARITARDSAPMAGDSRPLRASRKAEDAFFQNFFTAGDAFSSQLIRAN